MLNKVKSTISEASKGIILSSEGKSFSAGGDIVQIVNKGYSPRYVFAAPASLNYFIHTRQQETISIVDGLALGGGAGYALSCSSKILTNKTAFAIPEVRVGHSPDVGACYHLNKLCSEQLGIYMIITGDSISGPDTYFAGFSDIFVPKITKDIREYILNNGVNGLEKFQEIPDSEKSLLLRNLPIINQCFDRIMMLRLCAESFQA
jgi:enoyl-CoA hydratase/carnithine racemase